MFDQTTPKGRVLAAALTCAAKKSWADVTLLDIAEAAQLPLGALRDIASSKSDILAQLVRAVDDEVLKRAPKRSEGQEPRDHLFDIIMTRFEVMAPYKPALKRISSYLACRPGEGAALACSTLASQYWMLAGAGAKLAGPGGPLRVAGLTGLYARVFQVWLGDNSPSLDKTMAALDRRLTDGERWLASAFVPRRRDSGTATPPPAGPAPSPAPSVH